MHNMVVMAFDASLALRCSQIELDYTLGPYKIVADNRTVSTIVEPCVDNAPA